MPKKRPDCGATSSVETPAVATHRHRWLWAVLLATVIVANADIMALELVAGRLIARYLGQSLYTWTTIIGVVLTGMSIGHVIGGRFADRFSPRKTLPLLFLWAGLSCISILWLNAVMGRADLVRDFAWPLRIFTHIMVTFLVPCIALGTINPVVARIALSLGKEPGRTVGIVYAAAAGGSIVGIFFTGFVLLAVAGVTQIVWVLGGVLLAIGVAYFFGAKGFSKLALLECDGPPPEEEDSSGSQRLWWAACATVFVSNGAFMVLELTASRMVTRYLGHSLYTWTILLGVVLAGITVGNYIGGRLADRFEARSLLARNFLLAALACLALPALNGWLGNLEALDQVSWVTLTLIHIGVGFFIPTVIIGTLGPIVACWSLGLGRPPGKTLGALYAWGRWEACARPS